MTSITIPFTYTAFGPKKGRVERAWAVVDSVEVEIEEASARDVEGRLTVRQQGADPIEMPVMGGRAWLPIQEKGGRGIDAVRLAELADRLHATTMRGKEDELLNDGLLEGSWHRDEADLKQRGRTRSGEVQETCENNLPERRALTVAKAERCTFLDGLLHTSRFEPAVSFAGIPALGCEARFVDTLNRSMTNSPNLLLRPDAALRAGIVAPGRLPVVGDVDLVDWTLDDRAVSVSHVAAGLANLIGDRIGETSATRREDAETFRVCLLAHHRRYLSDARFDPETAVVECREAISFLRRYISGPEWKRGSLDRYERTLDLLHHCATKPDSRPILEEDDDALGLGLDGVVR